MAFNSTFGRVFSPTFQPRSVASGVEPWWLSGGIAAANCVAAYQPKGALNFESSKINLADPGVYDLINGVAYPSWETGSGWTFAKASVQYLYISSAIVSVKPLSMICRFYPVDVLTNYALMSINNSTSSNYYYGLFALGGVAGDPVQAGERGTTAVGALTTTSFTATSWHIACGVYITNTSRSAYLDAGGVGTNTTTSNPTGLNLTKIGAYLSENSLPFDGKIAACAFYNINITDYIASLTAAMNAL